MKFKVHQKLEEAIRNEERDIAFITAPGMGLSTLLQSLSDINNAFAVYITTDALLDFWDTEFKNRSYNKRFIIHAATIDALLKSGLINAQLERDYVVHTNLKKFLSEYYVGDQNIDRLYLAIDDFDRLPDDLEKIILDELKSISDNKNKEDDFRVLNILRFVIGGCISFRSLYAESVSGISPATQFCKYYPNEFLLSEAEINGLLLEEYPEIMKIPSANELILDWSGGHLFYVKELAKWIINQHQDSPFPSVEHLVVNFKNSIMENNKISAFSYCQAAWDIVKADEEAKGILYRATKTRTVWDISSKAKQLMKLGFLLEVHTQAQTNLYQITNHIVDMYLRQRFAELGVLLPVGECLVWGMKTQNLQAYSLLLDIENTLRIFIGDALFRKNRINWQNGLDVIAEDGSNILGKVRKRMKEDIESVFATSDFNDPLISYLDFGDLAVLIEKNQTEFPKEFSQKAPDFLKELNFHRRRIAHSRPMTIEQISSVETRWKQMKKLMMKN